MINWSSLNEKKDELHAFWRTSGPTTRYVVIDNFLHDGLCEQLREGFRNLAGKRAAVVTRDHKHVRGKAGTPNWERMTPLQRDFFRAANSPEMCRYIQDITDIESVVADDDLFGGGLHEIRRGGYLRVHTDFNYHPTTGLNRRLNLLLYLNPVWKDEWNGHIELWNEAISRPYVKLQPIANRVLLFETTEVSYHGHPSPLLTPPDFHRRSMAVYYYSSWPEGLARRNKTGYQLTKQEWATLIGRVADLLYQGVDDSKAILAALDTDYQSQDIATAIRTLQGLRSAELVKEKYVEHPDGQVERVTKDS